MYKKLVKKYYLYKIFTISLPIKKYCNPTYYVMCKYLIKTTPFINIRFLLDEFYKLFCLFRLQFHKNYMIFFCSDKIFFLNSKFLIYKKVNYVNWRLLNKLYLSNWSKKSIFACIYNFSSQDKVIALVKDLKIISIGFIDYRAPLNQIDYVFPIDCTSFTNIYFFHFTLQKFLKNVKN